MHARGGAFHLRPTAGLWLHGREGLGQVAWPVAAIQQVPRDLVPPGQPEDLSPENSGYFSPAHCSGRSCRWALTGHEF